MGHYDTLKINKASIIDKLVIKESVSSTVSAMDEGFSFSGV